MIYEKERQQSIGFARNEVLAKLYKQLSTVNEFIRENKRSPDKFSDLLQEIINDNSCSPNEFIQRLSRVTIIGGQRPKTDEYGKVFQKFPEGFIPGVQHTPNKTEVVVAEQIKAGYVMNFLRDKDDRDLNLLTLTIPEIFYFCIRNSSHLTIANGFQNEKITFFPTTLFGEPVAENLSNLLFASVSYSKLSNNITGELVPAQEIMEKFFPEHCKNRIVTRHSLM